jgi:hypothetical protein
MNDENLTAAETALIFKIKIERVQELARLDILPHFHLGRQLRFSRAALTEFIKSGGKKLPGGWRREQPAA